MRHLRLLMVVFLGAGCGGSGAPLEAGPPGDALADTAQLDASVADALADAPMAVDALDALEPAADAPDTPASADVADAAADDVAPDVAPDAAAPDVVMPPEQTGPVNGWILLDADPVAMARSIDAAAAYGVNHIQLSHDIIMNIEDLLPGADGADARVALVSDAVARAHGYGMEVYAWVHEISGDPPDPAPCWAADGAFWDARADAYRAAFARVPGLDGVVLMFGSAPIPPWIALCGCPDWCDQFPGGQWAQPPPAERIRFMVEQLGQVIVGELGRRMLVRTFVHEPAEVAWHSEGLAGAQGVPFTGMHKAEVQDWHPYNPSHPCIGAIGAHPAVVEMDLAGEYWGLSELPFVAPAYYRYRMGPMWAASGLGAVTRLQRGSHHALGTPNEVNVAAVTAMVADPSQSLDAIWDNALLSLYGLTPGSEAAVVRRVLEATFPVRLKSHYVLGIWALEKSSDLPAGNVTDELHDRGKLPKWDPDWQETWDRVVTPDLQTVAWIWQEGTEAVEIAEESIAQLAALGPVLSPEDRADLDRRLLHQWYAARAFRAVDLVIWARKAENVEADPAALRAYVRWAHDELGAVAAAMEQDGLAGVSVASPGRIETFRANTAGLLDPGADPVEPELDLFSPLTVEALGSTSATLRFTVKADATVFVDYGLEIPDYGHTIEVGVAMAGQELTVTLPDLSPGERWVARLRAGQGEDELRGGDFWIFTPEP